MTEVTLTLLKANSALSISETMSRLDTIIVSIPRLFAKHGLDVLFATEEHYVLATRLIFQNDMDLNLAIISNIIKPNEVPEMFGFRRYDLTQESIGELKELLINHSSHR